MTSHDWQFINSDFNIHLYDLWMTWKKALQCQENSGGMKYEQVLFFQQSHSLKLEVCASRYIYIYTYLISYKRDGETLFPCSLYDICSLMTYKMSLKKDNLWRRILAMYCNQSHLTPLFSFSLWFTQVLQQLIFPAQDGVAYMHWYRGSVFSVGYSIL